MGHHEHQDEDNKNDYVKVDDDDAAYDDNDWESSCNNQSEVAVECSSLSPPYLCSHSVSFHSSAFSVSY